MKYFTLSIILLFVVSCTPRIMLEPEVRRVEILSIYKYKRENRSFIKCIDTENGKLYQFYVCDTTKKKGDIMLPVLNSYQSCSN